jgi:hypothetical protein
VRKSKKAQFPQELFYLSRRKIYQTRLATRRPVSAEKMHVFGGYFGAGEVKSSQQNSERERQ